MKMPTGKRSVLLAVLVVALGAAVYLNYFFADANTQQIGGTTITTGNKGQNLGDSVFVNGTTGSTKPTAPKNDYFSTARKNRESAREEAVALIQDVFNSVKTSESEREAANKQVAAIAAAIEQESKIENLVIAKGFSDCIAYIDNDECQVVVKGEDLQTQEMVQIMEIVTGASGIQAEKIKILAVNS